MKSLFKLILVAGCIFTLTGVTNESLARGGCGSYYVYSSSNPTCINRSCGLWDTTALVQNLYKKRQCVRANNTTYWQFKVERSTLDCAC